MKPTSIRVVSFLFVLLALATSVFAQQSQAVLGKIDHAALLEAVPALPTSPAEAHARTYGTKPNPNASDTSSLDTFYAPFNKRLTTARNSIQPALDAIPAHQQALTQRSIADANASPIVSRMGGVEKMSQMSEQELQQAAAQAAGSYQQSLSGGPAPSGGGMQAMMQRMMDDPAYQERFEKMSKQEQEAELQKYMGSAQAPKPPSGPTAAELQAQRAGAETKAVIDRQQELGAIFRRAATIDQDFVTRDTAILNTPGNHKDIAQQAQAKIAKIPDVALGEAGPVKDPAKMKAAKREWATLDRNRAAQDLQQRAVLYNQRKAQYKEVAASYSAWLRQHVGVTTRNAQLLDEATADSALKCEAELLALAEKLRAYNEDLTREAAVQELSYQHTMAAN